MFIWSLIVSFATAVLSGLGVGNAGLLVIWLVFALDLPQLTAQGLNLLFFLCSSGTAITVHMRRTQILWGCAALLIAGGAAGSVCGTALAVRLSAALLRRLFGGLLIVSGAAGLFKNKKISKKSLQE